MATTLLDKHIPELAAKYLRLFPVCLYRRKVLLMTCCCCFLLLSTSTLLYYRQIHQLSPLFNTRAVSWMKDESEVVKVCAPRSNIAFLKNHKCASSAIQNILFRYAEQHDLQPALPDHSNYFGGGLRTFRSEFYTGSPWAKLGVNIFAIHTKWNHDEVAKIMPNNTVYVTIIREPTSLFTSLFSYSLFQKRTGLTADEYILQTPVEGKRLLGWLGFNQMTWDLGMIKEDMNNLTKVARMVREASDRFDLVMVAERMEESLVLLAHLMCWPLSDVIVPKLNARSDKYHFNMSQEILKVLQEKQAPDHLVYDHFQRRFDSLVDAFGRERMAQEVSKLRNLTKDLMTKCKMNKKPSTELRGIYKPWSNQIEGYTAGNTTDKRCQRIANTELPSSGTSGTNNTKKSWQDSASPTTSGCTPLT
ncbi:hypothetical protein Pmani_026582 [Petrolisthes manimaculis]|uniref:Sulfotransferase n=1 Tax=Petrolisthes manimaculis TaxID=1843537 RepID=A0AAE1TX98_9EUCA|nr:hypothetical protein Pmani_026582 [Petrolisthes manimaculis]